MRSYPRIPATRPSGAGFRPSASMLLGISVEPYDVIQSVLPVSVRSGLTGLPVMGFGKVA